MSGVPVPTCFQVFACVELTAGYGGLGGWRSGGKPYCFRKQSEQFAGNVVLSRYRERNRGGVMDEDGELVVVWDGASPKSLSSWFSRGALGAQGAGRCVPSAGTDDDDDGPGTSITATRHPTDRAQAKSRWSR